MSGFTAIPSPEPSNFRILKYCENCGKLGALPPSFKYCGDCGQHLLAQPVLDPIDQAIAEMCLEQENLLKRKYLRKALSESVQ